jgi:metal-responsive CopG/Arc/MetJ family transcriptional regulator
MQMKERITITIDQELLDWLDLNIKNKIFATRSHGFEYLVKQAMDKK